MKVFHFLSVGVALALPQFAEAASPVTTAQRVGLVSALKTYCGRVDQADARRLDQGLERMLVGESERGVEQARQSTAYTTSYETYVSVFNELPADLGAQLCREVVLQSSGPRHDDDDRRDDKKGAKR